MKEMDILAKVLNIGCHYIEVIIKAGFTVLVKNQNSFAVKLSPLILHVVNKD